MANRAYAGVWCRDFGAASMILLMEGLLGTVPLSKTKPGIVSLVARAIGPDEAPVAEYDLRTTPLDAAAIGALAQEYVNEDAAFETQAFWDLWIYEAEAQKWELKPQPVEIFCYGPEYDGGAFAVDGQLQIDAGFEHLFTGHGGLLSGNGATREAVHPAEEEFFERMREPLRLREYQTHTQENIRKLIDWMEAIQKALPVERLKLWSEGEEDFEGRMDEILERD